MTDGEAAANGTKEIRRFESENVARMYPNIHYTYLGFNGMCIDSYNKEHVLSIIKIANNKGCYFVSSIITSSLIISLLQEGHYNIMTIYTCLIVSFYYILYKRLNEN